MKNSADVRAFNDVLKVIFLLQTNQIRRSSSSELKYCSPYILKRGENGTKRYFFLSLASYSMESVPSAQRNMNKVYAESLKRSRL